MKKVHKYLWSLTWSFWLGEGRIVRQSQRSYLGGWKLQHTFLLLNGGHFSLPLSLSLSLSSLFLFCFLSFLPGCSKIQLHYTVSLCHGFIAFLSQKYERLIDCPEVTGCIFLQPQEREGFVSQNLLGVNFPEVFVEKSKGLEGCWFSSLTRWSKVFLKIVVD